MAGIALKSTDDHHDGVVQEGRVFHGTLDWANKKAPSKAGSGRLELSACKNAHNRLAASRASRCRLLQIKIRSLFLNVFQIRQAARIGTHERLPPVLENLSGLRRNQCP